MLNLINVNRPVTVNGVVYPTSQAAYEALKDFDGQIEVIISSEAESAAQAVKQPVKPANQKATGEEYRVHVKKWMTEKSSPGFDLMKKLNDDVPMPMVIMRGYVIEETRGMYHMELRALPAEPQSVCMVCGRTLKHPVSVLYGIGPECGGHFHINPMSSKAELDAAMSEIKHKLSYVTWSGWVVKSAIKEMTPIEADS